MLQYFYIQDFKTRKINKFYINPIIGRIENWDNPATNFFFFITLLQIINMTFLMVHICTQSLILLTLNFYSLDSLCPREDWSPKISQSNQPSANFESDTRYFQ